MRATSGATGAKPDQPIPYEVGGYRRSRWPGLGLVGGGSRTMQGVLGLAVQVLCQAADPIARRTSAAARSPLSTAPSIFDCDV
jgi:hypothetical protein